MPATATDRLYGLTTSSAIKPACRVATTANITLSGLQTIDGVTVAADDRVLVKDQTNAVNNGIYYANTSAWTRTPDFDGALDAVNGTLVIVREGTANPRTVWKLTTDDPVDIGTDSLTFEKCLLQDSATAIFVHSVTGAVERDAQDKMRDVVSALDLDDVLCNGSNDDAVGIRRALNSGRRVYCPGGRTYRLETSLESTGDFLLEADPDAVFLVAADVPAVQAEGTFSSPATVTAISSGTYDFDGGNTNVSVLTVSGGDALAAGDVCRIVSNDVSPYTGSNERNGEVVTVGAVSGATVYLMGLLKHTYTTATKNVRIARYSTKKVEIKGGKWGADDSGDAAGWTADLFSIVGINKPRLDAVEITKGYGAGIELLGCNRALVDKPKIKGLYNETVIGGYAQDRLGYGVKDQSSTGTQVIAPQVEGGRHAYTTAQASLSADDSRLAYYGKTMYSRVIDGDAVDVLGVAWDFHADAWECEFINCDARYSVNGDNAAGSSWQLRGYKPKVRGGKGRSQRGLVLYQQFTGSLLYPEVEGIDVESYEKPIQVVHAAAAGTSAIPGVVLRNVKTKCTGALSNIYLQYCDAVIDGGSHEVTQAIDAEKWVECGSGVSSLKIINKPLVRFEDDAVLGTADRTRYIVSSSDAANKIELLSAEVTGGRLDAIFSAGGADAQFVCREEVNLSYALEPTYIAGVRGVTSTKSDIAYTVDRQGVHFITAVNLADATHYINVYHKWIGKQVYDTTNNKVYFAIGTGATSKWRPFDDFSGGTDITPA